MAHSPSQSVVKDSGAMEVTALSGRICADAGRVRRNEDLVSRNSVPIPKLRLNRVLEQRSIPRHNR